MTAHPLPKFVIIGAAKAATTWLCHQLQHVNGVYLPDPEPHFFSREFDRGLGWYAQFFQDAAPGDLLGEKSADYLANPYAAERLARTAPDTRLIVQLRNPVERAYSAYRMLYRRGTVKGLPQQYLRNSSGEMPHFLEDGLYERHLKRWLDHFPAESLLVLLHEDVRQDPAGSVRRACVHIGAREVPSAIVRDARINDGAAPLLPLAMRKLLSPLKQAAGPLRGKPGFETVRRAMARPVKYPPLPADVRRDMVDYYAEDVAGLSALIGRDLTHWISNSVTN